MSNSTNHWKLGLFVVMGVISIIGAVVFFGGRSMRKESVAYKTYFDESVQGLEVGSPVKFRGVTIGSVSHIDLAGDKRHVAVTYELGVKVLHSLGLAVEELEGSKTKLVIPDDLRVQLASSGITGVKFMQMDFFDVSSNPPPDLPSSMSGPRPPAVAGSSLIPGASMLDIEREAILRTMEMVDGSTARAAEVLGISIRKIQ